jgi:hypothetical protein
MTMYIKSALVAATLLAFVAVSSAVLAADDSAVASKLAPIDIAKSSQAVQPPAVKNSKPHSHAQEKSGVAPTQALPPTAEAKARKHKMHQHPGDAK